MSGGDVSAKNFAATALRTNPHNADQAAGSARAPAPAPAPVSSSDAEHKPSTLDNLRRHFDALKQKFFNSGVTVGNTPAPDQFVRQSATPHERSTIAEFAANAGQNPAAANNLQALSARAASTGIVENSGRTPMAPAGSAVAAGDPAAAASAVDFNRMSQEQQYDYLKNMTLQQAGAKNLDDAWKSGEGEVNIIGIRSFQNGQSVAGEADKYNDSIYVCRIKDGQKQVEVFNASTDAGIGQDPRQSDLSYKVMTQEYRTGEAGIEKAGYTHLADGFYNNAFARGTVNGGEAGLEQVGYTRVNVDYNNNGLIEDNERQGLLAGAAWKLQFHRGGSGETVGDSSAGCQVIKADEYDRFQQILSEAPKSQYTFNYTLVDGSKLPSPNSDFALSDNTDIVANQQSGYVFGGRTVNSAEGKGVVVDEHEALYGNRRESTYQGYLHSASNNGDYYYDPGLGVIRTPDGSIWRPFFTLGIQGRNGR